MYYCRHHVSQTSLLFVSSMRFSQMGDVIFPPWQHHFTNLQSLCSTSPSLVTGHHWSFYCLCGCVRVSLWLWRALAVVEFIHLRVSTLTISRHTVQWHSLHSWQICVNESNPLPIPQTSPAHTVTSEGPVKGNPKSKNKGSLCFLIIVKGYFYLKATSSTYPTFNSFSTLHIQNKPNVPLIGHITVNNSMLWQFYGWVHLNFQIDNPSAV